MKKKYYLVLIRDTTEDLWRVHSGDYDKQTVSEEAQDYYDGLETKARGLVRITMLGSDSQHDIDAHVARLNKRPIGWHHGEYYCPCGTVFGKNLFGDSPFALVAQHAEECSECHAEREQCRKSRASSLTIHLPFQITPRLMCGAKIGNGWVSLGYANRPGDEGRTRYGYFIDLPEKRSERVEYYNDDIQSGCGGGDIAGGFSALLSFLSAWVDALEYRDRTGRESENADLFPKELEAWARENSDEFSMLAMELDPDDYCDCNHAGTCAACKHVLPIVEA